MTNLLDLTLPELTAFLAGLGEPAFRARQVFQWLWQKGAPDFATMTNVSKALRARLAEAATIARPALGEVRESRDGTLKLLLRLADGELIETVLIPEATHYTQCLSTQVGCAMACRFCSTGTMGFTRNLSQGEILGQILVGRALLAERFPQARLRNLVLMGMGEPLLNLDTVLASLTTLTDPLGLDFSRRRVTLSTVGVPDKLEAFAATGLARLAVSLHAPTQELRETIMPKAARMLPLPELIERLAALPIPPRERITFEYLLLKEVNDTPAHARELVRLLSRLRAKVNLIAYNPSRGMPYDAPGMDRVLAFEQVLRDKHLTVILRKSKGQDIEAACGQLVTAHAL